MSFEDPSQMLDSYEQIDRFMDFIDNVITFRPNEGLNGSDLELVQTTLRDIFPPREMQTVDIKKAIIRSVLIYQERNPMNLYIPLRPLRQMPHTPARVEPKSYSNHVGYMARKIRARKADLQARGVIFPDERITESVNIIATFLQWAKQTYEAN